MWWQIALGLVLLAIGAVLIAAVSIASAVDEAHQKKSSDLSVMMGIFLLCGGAAMIVIGSLVRSQMWGCPSYNAMSGLDSNTPYRSLSSTKIGDKVYSFVQLVDQADKQPVRCVSSDTELPKIFAIGSGDVILTLSPVK